MAIPVLNDLDLLNSGQILKFRVENAAADSYSGMQAGAFIYDSGSLKFYNGSAWVTLGTGSGSGTVTQVDGGDGMTGSVTSSGSLAVGAGTGITVNDDDVAVSAAQTGITSVYNTSLKLGRSSSTEYIDFSTDNIIKLIANGGEARWNGTAFVPGTDDASDLGSSTKQWRNLYIDGTAEVDALTINGTASVAFESADHTKLDGIEANATADQTDAEIRAAVEAATNSNVFTDADHSKLNGIEASADVTDTANVKSALNASLGGAATIGDGSDTITIPGSLTVTGTTTTNNVETVSTSNGVIFEGNAADANEVTLLAGSVTADRTITLPDATGTVVLADATQTLTNKTIAASQVTEISNLSAAEGAQLENINSVTISNTQWGYLGALDQSVITTADVAFNSLDIAGDADIDGTLETDALTINGTAIAEYVQDTVGAMFTGNTETRISATYQDSDGTIDLVVNDMTANTQLSTAAALIDVSTMAGNSTASFTHGLASKNLIVQMYDTTSGLIVHADVDHTSNSAISITFANTGTELAALGIGDIRVVVIDAKNGVSDSTVSYS